jgi:phenylalanyl-tRNA synthetase alpha chain
MNLDIEALLSAAKQRIEQATTLEDLHAAEIDLVGKQSDISKANRQLGGLDPDQRREVGRSLGEARSAVEVLIAEKRVVLSDLERRKRLAADRLDLTELPDATGAGLSHISPSGHLHLVQRTREELEDVFVGMGLVVAEGPEVETDWYNFEALNIPPAHPARAMWDTFYLDIGEPGTVLLRTHTSPVQIRLMQSQPPPIYALVRQQPQ